MAETLDINKLIADAKASRAASVKAKAALDKAAAAVKATNKSNAKFKLQAQNKLTYANGLLQTATDYEGRLRVFATQIARDGKLSAIDQKEFERIANDYSKVSDAYNKTVKEANAILAKAPSPTSVDVKSGKAEIGLTKEEKAQKELKNGKPAAQGSVDLIAQANAALAALADNKTATNYIYGLDDFAREALSQQLSDAGFGVTVTGKYNSGLVQAYQDALSQTQSENTFNKDVKGYIPNTLESYLTYRTGLKSGGAGGTGGGPKTFIDITNLSDVNAAGYIDAVFQSELKRKATAAEIKALTPALKAYVKSNPSKSTRTGGTTVADQGANPQDWLIQVVRGQQEITGFNLNDKKQAAKAAKATATIAALGEEYKTKQQQDIATYATDILKTVQSNGLGKMVGQSQIDTWAKRIKNGESQDVIDAEIRNIAKTGMPDNVKKMLDAGTNLDAIYSPYKQAMGSLLELNPETIALDDSTLRAAIGPTGEMPLYEFEKALKKDTRWQYTNNAKKEVSDNVLQILQDFGFQG
jgi:hypothetical protein